MPNGKIDYKRLVKIARSIKVWPEKTNTINADFKRGLPSHMMLIEDDDGGLSWVSKDARQSYIKTVRLAEKNKTKPSLITD